MQQSEKTYLSELEMANPTIEHEQIETPVDEPEKRHNLLATYIPDDSPDSHHKSAAERRLVLKADLVILPFAAIIFFIAYLDRNGIGNARIMGLQKDLNLPNDQYFNCLTLFIVGYVIFLLPANIVLRYFHPHQTVGTAVIFFGVLVAGLSAAHNYGTVLALRILTGAGQAFIQGLGIYIGLWYKRDELATRAGLYYSAAVISGAFGGLIAYGVQKDLTLQATGRQSWRWLFIIDGAITLGIGVLTWICLPKFPDKIKGKHWLFSREEIDLAVARSASYNTPGAKVDPKQFWIAVKDPKTWFFVVIACGATLGLVSVGLFLPTFIVNFGYSALHTQLLSIIPSASATFTLLVVCFLSDRFNVKGIAILFCQTLAVIGYILLLTATSNKVKLVGASFVASGVYPTIVLLVAWLSINTGGFTKRGTTWGLCEVIGNTISIIGTHVYNTPPKFVKGHCIVLGFVVVGIFNTIAAMLWMNHLNKKRDREAAELLQRGEVHPQAHLSLEEAYDFHPSFRYII